MTPEDYKKLIGVGELYKGVPRLDPKDMFKNPLWHIHIFGEMAHYCFIHGVNLFSGGNLFDLAEKFSELYAERTKTAKNYALTDVTIEGVSLLNLQWIVYNPNTNMWHSPKLHRVIERIVMHDLLEKAYTLGSLFDLFEGDRFLVQTVDVMEELDSQNPLSHRDSHVVVITKVDNEWYLLCVTLEKPLCFSKEPKKLLVWLNTIDYMNVFKFEGKELSVKKSEPLLKEWNRIMNGEPPGPKGGNQR